MIEPKKAAKLIRQHFEELTTEQFVENLHRSCPEIFEDQKQSHQVNFMFVNPTGNIFILLFKWACHLIYEKNSIDKLL